jgi:hypothetical protein
MATITAGFALFPFEGEVQQVLKSLGFQSVYDIAHLEENRFIQEYDILLNGHAGAIYQHAKNYLAMADQHIRRSGPSPSASAMLPDVLPAQPQLGTPLTEAQKARLARYQQPLYERLFTDDTSRLVTPGSLQSLDSPVSYLVYLLTLLHKMQFQDGKTRASALQSLLTKRPDLGTLLLNEDAFTHVLPSSELAGEILQSALVALTGQSDIDTWQATNVYPLMLPFDLAHTRINLALEKAGLCLGDAYTSPSDRYRYFADKRRAALAWSGTSQGLLQHVTKPLNAALTDYPPMFLCFQQEGQPIAGSAPLLSLGLLWPGSQLTKLSANAVTVTCSDVNPPGKSIDIKLTFDPHSGTPNALSVTAQITSIPKPENGKTYRGIATVTVKADGLDTRAFPVGILVGDGVGTQMNNQAVFATEAASLANTLGTDISSAVGAVMTVPIDMLSQAAGLSRRQLQEAFAIDDFAPAVSSRMQWDPSASPVTAGVYGASYLWRTAAGVDGALPGTVQADELLTTPGQLDRLQKLIRLQHVTQLPYAALDTLLQTAIEAENGHDISVGTLRALGVYQRYQRAYQLDAEQVAALLGPLSYCALPGQQPLLTRVLACVENDPAWSSLPFSSTTHLPKEAYSLLASALAISVDELTRLIDAYQTDCGVTVTQSVVGISCVYRAALLAKTFSVSVETLLQWLDLVCNGPSLDGRNTALMLLATPRIKPGVNDRDTLDLLLTLDEVFSWAQEQKRDLNTMLAALQHDDKRDQDLRDELHQWRVTSSLDVDVNVLVWLLQNPKVDDETKGKVTQELTSLVTVMSQHAHVDAAGGWALLFGYAALLTQATKSGDNTVLTPLFVAADVITHYHLNEVALTPWRNGALTIDTGLPLWQQLLALSDFACLAVGDERWRPVLLSVLDKAERIKRLAAGYRTDTATVKHVLGEDDAYNVQGQYRLQRMAAFARTSGWSVADLDVLSGIDITSDTWATKLPMLSLRCGPSSETERATLEAQLGEKRTTALLAAYQAQCRRLIIADEKKSWESAWAEHEPTTADVADQLLCDPEMSSKVPTSRVAEATASVQAYIQRIADGREPQWRMTDGELQNWNNNDRHYAIWAANQQLRWHPDQYLNPAARLKKSDAFIQFENRLSQARLDQDSVDDALLAYLTQFEQVVNLDTIGAYQDGMGSAQSTIYCLGRSPHAPFSYYYRRWGKDDSGLRLWSTWQKINLPTTQNTVTQAPNNDAWNNYHYDGAMHRHWWPVQARLVTLGGRLYFIWVETRTVTGLPKKGESGTKASGMTMEASTPKSYQHVISLVHQRLNGDWSTPIELYQSELQEYVDLAPHLAAFMFPKEAAVKDLNSIKFTEDGHDSDHDNSDDPKKITKKSGNFLFVPNVTINSDLLVVALKGIASDPEQKKPLSRYWIFDENLTELRTSPRRDKATEQRYSYGLDLDHCEATNSVVKAIKDRVDDAYLYWYEDKSTSGQPHSYSTQVLTPCIPSNWLYSHRHWVSRDKHVFGDAVSLTLAVNGAGQKGGDSYETASTVTLSASQWGNVPADSKLVHFLSVQGRTEYQALTSSTSTVSLVTPFTNPFLSEGEARHGLVLVAHSASDIVSTNATDNAWIESGYLAVAHQDVQTLAAEIRENAQGVQFLEMHDVAEREDSTHGHTIHGLPDPVIDQPTVKIDGLYTELFVGIGDVQKNITVDQLNKEDDWMPVIFVQGAQGQRLSQWSYDLPLNEEVRKQVWLVTKVDKENLLSALKKLDVFPSDVQAYQISGSQLQQKATPGGIDTGKSLYLFSQIATSGHEQERAFTHDCTLPSVDGKAFSVMTFRFYLMDSGTRPDAILAPKGLGLHVIDQAALKEELQLPSGSTIFTKADWGWTAPVFSTATSPYRMNRSYRLQSPACQYLLVKVDTTKMTVATSEEGYGVGFSIGVQPMLNIAPLPGYAVVGLKSGKPEIIKPLDGEDTSSHIKQQGNALMLVGKTQNELTNWLQTYSHMFFALPWTANALSDVKRYGLRFQFSYLKDAQSLFGYIPCEVPSLSAAVISSACSPTHAAVGDTVTITADVDIGTPDITNPVLIEIALNGAYQWTSGLSMPAQTQIVSNGVLRLQLPQGQQHAHFSLPVTVLNVIGNVLPLATLTVTDHYSARRVMLEQPVIDRAQQVDVAWEWRFGRTASDLKRSATARPITYSQLTLPCVLTTLQLSPSRHDMQVAATLTLPEGITVNVAYLNELKKIDAFKAGLALIEEVLKEYEGKSDKLTLLPKNSPLPQSVLLPVPVKVLADQPIDAMSATVHYGKGETDQWTARSYPIGWAKKDTKGTIAVSASVTPHGYAGDKDQAYGYGDPIEVSLLLNALQDAQVPSVVLELPPRVSYSTGRTVATRIQGLKVSSQNITGAYDRKNNALTFPLGLKLNRGESYILTATVDAIPDELCPVKEDQLYFTVNTAANEAVETYKVKLGQIFLGGVTANVVPVRSNDTTVVIDAGTSLPIGARFSYRVSFAMDEASLRHQLGKYTEPTPGPQLTLNLPFAQSVTIEENIGTFLTTDLPLLTEVQADSMKKEKLWPGDYGCVVASPTKVIAQTVAIPGQGIRGEILVPVRVKKAGAILATLNINPQNKKLQQPEKWTQLNKISRNSLSLVSFDTNALPFSDLQFTRRGAQGFTDPIAQRGSALLSDKSTQQRAGGQRYVRLNSQFGQELVRIAQRNTRAIFQAATQDHPLLPMLPDGAPDPLEQDVANLLYFWEMFYHVPALIAYKLNQDGRYEEAQTWLHHLISPTLTQDTGKPTAVWRCRLLTTAFSYVSLDQATGPVDPDVIASVQPEFYRRAVFFAYVKNLLDQGDSYYRTLSREGFNNAHQCYLRAAHLLGEEPPVNRVPAWKPVTAQMAVERIIEFASRPDALFAVPRSQLHQSLVDKLQQRLFNLRHGLTLDGKPMSLPLYDPPLDPAQLLAMRAAGALSGSKALSAQRTLPAFRYSTLYARANAAVDTVIQFGAMLLSQLTAQQDLNYQTLLINQQKEMSDFVISQQQTMVLLNQQARQGLVIARDAAQRKLDELNSWIEKDVSDQESRALSLRSSGSQKGIGSAAMRATGAALDMAPNIFGMADGGAHWGAIPQALGEGLMAMATADEGDALQIETREMYRHRKDEWQQVQREAEATLQQLDVQLQVDTLQQANLMKQLTQSQAQAQQFEQQLSFMSARFTNDALYQWLTNQVSGLYYQVYDVATALCLQTLAAWQYEVGDYSAEATGRFFKNGGWNDARRGLLAGENLRLGLLQMDQAYLAHPQRMREIRHTLSVKRQLLTETSGPVWTAGVEAAAAVRKKKGHKDEAAEAAAWNTACEQAMELKWRECLQPKNNAPALTIPIAVAEKMLAERYPGHYQRQTIAVSVTLPCVMGPYEEACATLTQTDSRFAVRKDVTYKEMQDDEPSTQIIKNLRPGQAIALSSGLDDNGIQLNFSEGKHLPFEGNGVVGTWNLIIPNPKGQMQQRMLSSLSDVIVTFRYRAKDGGELRAGAILKELEKEDKTLADSKDKAIAEKAKIL